MSDYKHRMSLAVPQSLMTQAFSDMGLTIIETDEVRALEDFQKLITA